MTIVYAVIKILLFPGTYVKGFWEHFTCKILGLPVEFSGYFCTDEVCGHVDHSLARKPLQAFVMAIGPSVMNLFLGATFFSAGYKFIFEIGIRFQESSIAFILGVVLLYLGISFLGNVFPMIEDAMNLYDILYSQKKGNVFFRIFAFIPTALAYAGAYLERYCITPVIPIISVIVVAVMKAVEAVSM